MAIISISGKANSGKDEVGKIIQYLKLCERFGYTADPQEYVEHYHKTGHNVTDPTWKIKKWAGSLRKVAAILLGMDEEFLYTEEFKQMVLPECWDYKILHPTEVRWVVGPMTGRTFLQKLGTDAVRNGLHENAWVNSLMSEYKPLKSCIPYGRQPDDLDDMPIEYPNWIITDTRFPNELAAVKERGAITIRVERDLSCEVCGYTQAQHRGALCKDLTCPKGRPLHPSETALDSAEFDFTIVNNGIIEELITNVKNILNQVNGKFNEYHKEG